MGSLLSTKSLDRSDNDKSDSTEEIPVIPTIDVKIQMKYILLNWTRAYHNTDLNTSFSLDIIELIIDVFCYQHVFDTLQKRKIANSQEYNHLYQQNFANKHSKSRENNCDYYFNLFFLGDKGVGKRSLLTRFVDDTFHEDTLDDEYCKTKRITIDNTVIIELKLKIWDPSIYRYKDQYIRDYYASLDLIIMVYDIKSIDSFENVIYGDWKDEFEAYAPSYMPKVLVGTKMDAISSICDDEYVQFDKAKESGKELDFLHCLQVSAKTGENVGSLFDICVGYVYDLNKDIKTRAIYPFYG